MTADPAGRHSTASRMPSSVVGPWVGRVGVRRDAHAEAGRGGNSAIHVWSAHRPDRLRTSEDVRTGRTSAQRGGRGPGPSAGDQLSNWFCKTTVWWNGKGSPHRPGGTESIVRAHATDRQSGTLVVAETITVRHTATRLVTKVTTRAEALCRVTSAGRMRPVGRLPSGRVWVPAVVRSWQEASRATSAPSFRMRRVRGPFDGTRADGRRGITASEGCWRVNCPAR